MSNPQVRNLPTEVQLAIEVMPCQAMRRAHEPAQAPHPCAYFAEWGAYHSYDYATSGPPEAPGIVQPVVYMGKTALVPEILSGCRKAPIMAVGINPNLPGYWPSTRNAVNPLFEDFVQYAHYFRYRSVAKLQMTEGNYETLRAGRNDPPTDPTPLTAMEASIAVELAELKMYEGYQDLLDGLAEKQGWIGHNLAVGEDLSYANMVACPSAKWVVNRPDSRNPEMPIMGTSRMRGIVNECFHERRYFLRQLFQSLPPILLVFSQSTAREFITAMAGRFTVGDPQLGESIDDLLSREIRMRYGTTTAGVELDARVIFTPHITGTPAEFERLKGEIVNRISEEISSGKVVLNANTGHLGRPRGGCVFCSNALYRIGPCDYLDELVQLADGQVIELTAADGSEPLTPIMQENTEQAKLLSDFLGEWSGEKATPQGPTPAHLGPTTTINPTGTANTIKPNLTADATTGFGLLNAQAKFLNVDPLNSPAVALRGRIVTMDRERKVLENATLYIRDGTIAAITGLADPAPTGFETAPVVETGGTIYPGLLDLHNHLAYNVATLWKVPRRFTNRSQWQRHDDYARNVKIPLEILTRDGETSRAIVRYVEVKALLGGTTAVQGMRSRFSKLRPNFAGLVRNFEYTDDPQLPAASGRIPDLDIRNDEQIASFRNGLHNNRCYFYHLSEGVDAAARQQFLNLERLDLLDHSLAAIHALGLQETDIIKLNEGGSKVVWSPMSNLLLYGSTLDVRQLLNLNVPFALGCDWSPSGSKNLLEEIKVAWLQAQADGAGLTPADLCAAVTCNAAAIVGWGDTLGTIEAGKYADLLVLEGQDDDPYETLLKASERAVRLVMIAGYARLGDSEVMSQFELLEETLETLLIGGREKKLNLQRGDVPLKKLGFGEAMVTLRNAMGRLREINAELQSAPFELAADDEDFTLELDNDDFEEMEGLEPQLAAIEVPESVELDIPTVIDDAGYFDRLETISHLPASLRGLRSFYE